MPTLPTTLNGVRFTFHPNVNADVDPRLLAAIASVARAGVPYRFLLHSVFIRSASDSHVMPSRHAQSKAVDIAALNGRPILGHYGTDPEITELVNRLQQEWERVPGRRENFGPHLKLKSGVAHPVPGHHDHIHFSVD